jgi:hypothetical protein
MGDRACVSFYDSAGVSPAVYLHWHADHVPGWLAELKQLMKGRLGDAAYAAARFIGLCHLNIEGELSLGVWSNSFALAKVQDPAVMGEERHGDAGMVVVDTRDFGWKAYGGYLALAGRA